MINDNQIAGIMEKSTGQVFTEGLLKTICNDLIRGAINGGGKDNISVVLAAVEHGDVPSSVFRPMPVRHNVVLSWDDAVEGRFVDDSFIPIQNGKQ